MFTIYYLNFFVDFFKIFWHFGLPEQQRVCKMIVYSKKIFQFINEIKRTVKTVLSTEIRLRVARERFYDQMETASYPIKIVIYNNKAKLGYFDPNFYELGFHECLMHAKKEQLHAVIRHELAHYMTFITYGGTIQHHGPEFKAFCEKMGWGEEVYKATTSFDADAPNIEESPVLRKVQKLMNLAKSSNENEAESAMIKSQQLLLKHNIEFKYIGGEDDEKIFVKRIMENKRENAKMRTVARILETFFVSVVYHRGGDFIYLEILGSAVNIEIAEYVAAFLDTELEKLWRDAQKTAALKGMIAKNSFFLGIAKGYCNKIQALKREYDQDVARALLVIEKKLIDAKEMVYPRLSSSKSSQNYCRESSLLGEQMGRALNINPALNRSLNPGMLIAYS